MIIRFVLSVTPLLEVKTGVKKSSFEGYERIVDTVFLPDIAAVLVGEDYNCSLEEAYHLSWLSQDYGLREFPHCPLCPVLRALQLESSKELREVLLALEKEPVDDSM